MGARVSSGTFPAGISLLLEPGGLLQHGEFLAVGDLKKKNERRWNLDVVSEESCHGLAGQQHRGGLGLCWESP